MRFPVLGRLEDAETGEVLLQRLYVAETFWQRLRGLQFARPLDSDSGLLLRNCRSVHTLWMRFAIDVVFLSDDFVVLEVQTDVKPWRIALPRETRAAHVIEVTAGQNRHLSQGMKTRFTSVEQVLTASRTAPSSPALLPRRAGGEGSQGGLAPSSNLETGSPASASAARSPLLSGSPRPASGRGAGGEGPHTNKP